MYVIYSTLILQTIQSRNVPDTIGLPAGTAVTLKTVLEKSPVWVFAGSSRDMMYDIWYMIYDMIYDIDKNINIKNN